VDHVNSHPIHIYLPNLKDGGAQHVMIRLANHYVAHGFNVTLIVDSADGVQRNKIGRAVNLMDLQAGNMLEASVKLARFLKVHRPPTLLCAMTFANLPAVVAKRIARVSTKIVISERHACTEWLRGRRWTRRILYSVLIPLIYPHADAIIAVSRGVASDLARFINVPKSSIDIIYNPSTDVSLSDVDRPKDVWFDEDEPPIVLGMGRLHPQKGFDVLIRAFALVLKQQAARLVIVGEGPEREGLLRLAEQLDIAKYVRLTGYATDPIPYFAFSRVYVLSSRYEGFPNALVEALSCGTTVVSTDCESGPREILAGGHIAPLVPVEDAEALAQAIVEKIRNPNDPEVLRSRAAAFSITEIGEQYLAVLGRVEDVKL
jgi:glycosyltransferase involved in cell wall biosynthesis